MKRYEISFTNISFAAGTPGTRSVQLLNNTTVPSNEHIVNIFCSHISDSSLAIAYPFMAGIDDTTGKTNIYLNLYRASTSAVSGYSVVVRVITVPKMNT